MARRGEAMAKPCSIDGLSSHRPAEARAVRCHHVRHLRRQPIGLSPHPCSPSLGLANDAATPECVLAQCRCRASPEDRGESRGCWSRCCRAGFAFSFFYRIPPIAGNEISPNFANSERKENSNSKNEISVNSDRNFGDFDRKMMSVMIFVLFPRSNEKLLNTNFVQFFEI